jgi:hypothetical protein
MAKPKLGSGGRFKALSDKIAKEPGYNKQEADAVAAKIGRAKYGAKKMGDMAAKGKKGK